MKDSKIVSFCRFITGLLSTCMMLVALASLVGMLILPMFHYKPYIVLSGSMEPKIQTGAVVWVNENDTNVEVGDIVAYQLDNGTAVTHRIVEENNGMYVTKGDANETEDLALVSQDQIIGTYAFSIPVIGYVISTVRSNMLILIPVVCFILIVLIADASLNEVKGKRKKARTHV